MTTPINFGKAFATFEHTPFMHTGSSGKAWLLIHGFPGSPSEMRSLAMVLENLGDTTCGILLPGFGAELDSLRHKTATDWLNHAQGEYRRLRAKYDFVGVLGFSMGGAIAAQVAALEIPNALILIAPFWKLNHVLWHTLPVLKHVIPQFKPFRLFKPNWSDPKFIESVRNFMPEADLNDSATRQAILDFEIPVSMIDQIRQTGLRGYAAASKITCPTLVIQGVQDALVTPANTRDYLKAFNNAAKYVEVAGPHTLFDKSLLSWFSVSKAIVAFASAELSAKEVTNG